MFTDSENEIISSNWALSEQHSRAWLLMLANILKGDNARMAISSDMKESQKEMRRYIIDQDGQPINRSEYAQTPEGSIGVVLIAGPMIKYGGWFYYGADDLVRFAQEFDNDPGIVGQIWLMDSGGGSVNAIAPYLEFLKRKKKPVIGLADTCASANYYVACGLDKLFARNTISAMFGSIGVVATIYDYRKYLKNLGVEEHMIYATQSTHKHKSYNEALEGDYKSFKKEHLDPLAQQFQNFVTSKRPNIQTDVEGIISGSMFYTEQALEYGMIDGVMDFEEAVDQVKLLASARSFMNQF